MKNIEVNSFYRNIQLVPNPELAYGAQFIEEGVCEYIVHKKGESAKYETIFIPSCREDIKDNFEIKYKYAYFYLKDFLDTVGIKHGIMMLLHNKPPTYDELLDRDLFVNRLIDE